MWILKPTVLVPILFGTIVTTSVPVPIPTDKLDKNKEYICVQWTGSADFTQNKPSVCLKWEAREKPFFRRV